LFIGIKTDTSKNYPLFAHNDCPECISVEIAPQHFMEDYKFTWHINLILSAEQLKIIAMPTAPKAKSNPAVKTSQADNSASKSKSGNGSKPAAAPAKRSEGENTLLEKFLLDALKDIYWAEKHLTKALPKMKKAATSNELKNAFDQHLAVTEQQIGRLEQVFDMLGKKAQAKKCEAMEGLVKEADSITEETEKGTSTRDVGLIMAAQKVEHYEIATYGGLVQLTKILGLTEASALLAKTLAEEKEADEALTSIAENDINLQAEQEGEGDEQGQSEEN